MARPRDATDLPEAKTCTGCGETFVRPRRRGYSITHNEWRNRRFCSDPCRRRALGEASNAASCAGTHPSFKGDAAGAMAGRARARKLVPELGQCSRCPAPAAVRHHRDDDPLNNDLENIEPLCRACHVLHHKPVEQRWAKAAA